MGLPLIGFCKMYAIKKQYSDHSIFELLAEWDQINRSTISKDSVKISHSNTKRFIWCSNCKLASDITLTNIQHHIVYLIQDKHLSVNTVHNVRASLSGFCRFLQERGEIPVNPCPQVKLPRLVIGPPKFLDQKQIADLLVYAKRTQCYYEIKSALQTGLRRSELADLQWPDINFASGLILVRRGKGEKSRAVPLVKDLSAEFQVFADPAGYVFPGTHGQRRASRCWDRLLVPVKNKFPWFDGGWHLLRHTFASQLARRGVSIAKIATWLGHSSVTLTMKYYANLSPDNYDQQIEKIGDFENPDPEI